MMDKKQEKVIEQALRDPRHRILEGLYLNPRFARLVTIEFRGSFLSNAGGTSLTPTQPSNWSGSSDFITYITSIRAQMLTKGTTVPPNIDVPASMQFQVRDIGRNFDWFDDNGLLFSAFTDAGGLNLWDMDFPVGWPIDTGTDLKCTYSQNTDIVAGLGNAVTFYCVVTLRGLQVRPQ